MKKQTLKRGVSLALASAMVFSLTACGDGGGNNTGSSSSGEEIPTIDQITVGEDYQDIEASIKVLTNRTDIVDTVYAGYAEEFMELYPNIKVEYEAVTDYEESLTLRLTTGDWGDLCFIPTGVDKSELGDYFTPLGDFDTLDPIYNFVSEKTYDGTVYGIANGGTANGVVYNKKVWADAGITELPKTPDEFLDDLQLIKDNTDAIPLYTNFSAGWPMGAWDAYIGIAATGNPDFMNHDIVHMKGSDWESSKTRINNGEIATMVLGSWAVQQCKDAGDTPEDVGYMPFPITVDGKQYAGAGGNYSFGINNQADSDNQIAAMVYLKWLIEESSIYEDEGSIPALKGEDLPEALADFEGVELLSDNPPAEGEETLFNDVNNQSEVGINNDDYPNCYLLECALYGSKTLDEVIDEWNSQWSAAQEALGVDVNM